MTARYSANKSLGFLCEEVRETARQVQRSLAGNTNVVWVDDRGDIFADEATDAEKVPDSWIVGTYGMGTPLEYIEEDFRAFVDQRAKSWILE